VIAENIWILTAFSVTPQKDFMCRCCLIHLKNNSTCHLCNAICPALIPKQVCPPEKIQTQIYSCGIESIESTSDFKFFSNTLSLSDRNHFVCKFLKDLAVSVRICFSKITARYHRLAESKMVRLRGMCRYYADKFSKTFTAGQLPVHHDQQLIPTTERFYVFVPLIFHNDTIKDPLWKKLNELTENIFSLVHNTLFYKSDTILRFQINTLKYQLYVSY